METEKSSPSSSPNSQVMTSASTQGRNLNMESTRPKEETPSQDGVSSQDELDLEVLGRQRPAVFSSTLQEVLFCNSLLVSMLMAVSFVLHHVSLFFFFFPFSVSLNHILTRKKGIRHLRLQHHPPLRFAFPRYPRLPRDLAGLGIFSRYRILPITTWSSCRYLRRLSPLYCRPNLVHSVFSPFRIQSFLSSPHHFSGPSWFWPGRVFTYEYNAHWKTLSTWPAEKSRLQSIQRVRPDWVFHRDYCRRRYYANAFVEMVLLDRLGGFGPSGGDGVRYRAE